MAQPLVAGARAKRRAAEQGAQEDLRAVAQVAATNQHDIQKAVIGQGALGEGEGPAPHARVADDDLDGMPAAAPTFAQDPDAGRPPRCAKESAGRHIVQELQANPLEELVLDPARCLGIDPDATARLRGKKTRR